MILLKKGRYSPYTVCWKCGISAGASLERIIAGDLRGLKDKMQSLGALQKLPRAG